jgi:hypothetical protein
MIDLYSEILQFVPGAKPTPNGWVSFNAPCCHHRGESMDKKKRGGLRRSGEYGAVFHCFNCSYKTGWVPGKPLNQRMKNLLSWMGATDEYINRIAFECLKTESSFDNKQTATVLNFEPRPFPKNSQLITNDLIKKNNSVSEVVNYMNSRGLNFNEYDFYWSDAPKFIDRFIIPLTVNHNKVGFVSRKIKPGNPKYLTEHPPNVVFNLDKQHWDNKFILVFESAIDAILLNGIAVLTNEVSDQQAIQINSTKKTIIVVPDRDKAGSKLIDHAIKYNWSVAFPNWESGIKDAGEAVVKYGKLTTMVSIINNIEDTDFKIRLKSKLWNN